MTGQSVAVRAVRAVGADAVAIELETPEGFDIHPGQFVLVEATVDGERLARHYTMSSPDADGTFEITVGVDPEGTLSPWLAAREPGDELVVTGPLGRTYYDDGGDVVVYAGGPGIGAGLGVAERALATGHAAALVAYLGDGAIAHGDRLGALAAGGHPAFVCRDATGFRRAVADLEVARPSATRFVFGFNPFVDLARSAIDAGGGDADAAQVERYG
ncbi:MAG: ferredoxin--NADP reductase [Halobacteriales archaeon]